MRFADIPGHDDIKARLVDMVDNNRMPHALILEGPQGIGKFMLVRALAQYIHCENRSEGDSCGRCQSCLQHASFNHVDAIFSFPIIKKNSNKPAYSADYLAEFKDLMTESPYMDPDAWTVLLQSGNIQPKIYVDEGAELSRRLNYHAHQAKYKIVMIWQPEKMNEDTANKMLKLIEEPHDDTIFIMSSNNPRTILPTIYSRVQRVAVVRYDEAQIERILTDTMAIAPEVAAAVAPLADGSMSKAISLTSISKSRKLFLDMFIDLMRKAYQRKIILLRQWSDDAAALGREQAIAFLDYSARLIRENFIMNLNVDELNRLSPDEKAFSVNFSRFINERNVLQLFDMINEARADAAGNTNLKILFFDVAVKTILLLKK